MRDNREDVVSICTHVLGRRTRSRRAFGLASVAALCAVSVGACGSSTGASTAGTQPAASGKVGALLTVSQAIGATTLNPALTNQDDVYFEELAYEPLIVRHSDGTYVPGLATSWHYSGSGNSTFVLNLRKGVKFSDGSVLTAADVVKDLRYVVKAGGQEAPLFTGDTFTATGPLQVTIKTKSANPDLVFDLTQDYNTGDIISPAGLADPKKLGTQTLGAGPYELDAAETVAGDHYTYVPNPYYYDKAAVHWKKVVVRVIASAQSVLSAMQTGQVNLTQGDPSTLAAAKRDGLTVTSAPLLWVGMTLADRNGKLAKPLAKLQVRQALNYATDRKTIATALYPGLGTPTAQPTVAGGAGYEAQLNDTYPYDPSKARSLLAAAGYPHGFSLDVVTTGLESLNLMAEALAQQWKAVGVTLHITDDANADQYEAAAFSGKVPAFMTVFGQLPIATEGPDLFLPSALFNPFHTASAALTKLYDRDLVSSGAAKQTLDEQVEAFLVHQAWFVPVVAAGLPYYATKNITGTSVTAKDPLVDLYQVEPAS